MISYEPADPTHPENLDAQLDFDADPASKPLWDKLNKIYPMLKFRGQISSTSAPDSAAAWTVPAGESSDVPMVELNKFALAAIEIFGSDSTLESESSIWRIELPVPLKPPHFYLPIPNPILFGKQAFALQLSNYGSIDKLQYTKNTGAAEATDAATALANALKRPSAAEQAAKLKAQADLIAVVRLWKRGSIDYKRVPALAGVDLEQYRGPAREETRMMIDQ